ncbi:MAG: sugar transporter permease [Microbacteriaceae bacterium]|jgi:ribose/xylose/arabinose/galactoside ABC-type transport system permease subunit|nr:sugar transporter permease [Microbacteriaceae bacterium]
MSPSNIAPQRETVFGAARSGSRNVAAVLLRAGLLPILLVALILVFSLLAPQFLAPANLINISRQSVFLLLVALGQMVVLLAAQLDLSVGATIAVTSVVTATVTSSLTGGDASVVPLGLAVGLGVGVAVGVFNGFFVAVVKVPSFMVTLGTTSILTGIALILSKGAPVSGVPALFTATLATGSVFGIPISVLIGIVIAVVVFIVLSRTTFGRNIYAVGGNSSAASVAGISVTATLIGSFVLCSVLASLAGVLLTARVASGEASLGSSYVMLSIAAAVLGGTSLFGGEGKLGLVILGVLFLGVLSNGMNILHVSSYVQELVIGGVLVAAVAIERLRTQVFGT